MDIQIPTDINDITLEQYQKFALINTEDQEKEFFLFKTIEIFCGVPMEVVSRMKRSDVEDISEEILAVLQQETKFETTFEMEGVTYGFIPDLQAITLGEFIDLEEGLSKPSQFHKAAAVMFRPIKKRFKALYTIDGYEASTEAHKRMKGAPIGVISASIVFFYRIVNVLLQDSAVYSTLMEEKEEEKTSAQQDNLQKNTDGFSLSTLFAEVMLPNIPK